MEPVADFATGKHWNEDEEAAEQHHRDGNAPSERLLGDLLLLGHLLIGRPRERSVSQPEGFEQRSDAADDRDVAIALGPRGNGAYRELDLAVGAADRDRPARRAAHHHALENRLPAHVARLGR